jgi:hypothetical protein
MRPTGRRADTCPSVARWCSIPQGGHPIRAFPSSVARLHGIPRPDKAWSHFSCNRPSWTACAPGREEWTLPDAWDGPFDGEGSERQEGAGEPAPTSAWKRSHAAVTGRWEGGVRERCRCGFRWLVAGRVVRFWLTAIRLCDFVVSATAFVGNIPNRRDVSGSPGKSVAVREDLLFGEAGRTVLRHSGHAAATAFSACRLT